MVEQGVCVCVCVDIEVWSTRLFLFVFRQQQCMNSSQGNCPYWTTLGFMIHVHCQGLVPTQEAECLLLHGVSVCGCTVHSGHKSAIHFSFWMEPWPNITCSDISRAVFIYHVQILWTTTTMKERKGSMVHRIICPLLSSLWGTGKKLNLGWTFTLLCEWIDSTICLVAVTMKDKVVVFVFYCIITLDNPSNIGFIVVISPFISLLLEMTTS